MFHIDNSAIVASISSGSSCNAQVENILRSFIMLAVWLGFFYSSSWVSSANNHLAGATSHFEYACLFTLAPSMKKKPCPMHPQLHGIKCTLTCPPGSPSFCGMAILPQPAQHIGQDRSPSQISSSSTCSSGTQMAQSSQPLKLHCSNGLPGWKGPRDFNQDNQVICHTTVMCPHQCRIAILSM